MLTLIIPPRELYDETRNEFIQCPSVTLQLEHSLLSISKWEAKWKKPFMSKEQKTQEEFIDYVRCMTVSPKVNPAVYYRLTRKNFDTIERYIQDPMTATTFHSWKKEKPGKKIITSEQVYYWMVAAQIPWEAEKWHFNRLMTLLRIYGIENSNSKMSKRDIYKQNRAINAARQAKAHKP